MSERSISERHRAVLKGFMEGYGNLDKELILNCLKDNVVWHIAPSFGMGDIPGRFTLIPLPIL